MTTIDADPDSWKSKENRRWVIDELNQIFDTYGNPMPKGSDEMESQLFDKSRNQVQYVMMAHRLLRTVLGLALWTAEKRSSKSVEVIAQGRLVLQKMGRALKTSEDEADFKLVTPAIPAPLSFMRPSPPSSEASTRKDTSPNPFRVVGTGCSAGAVLTDAVFPSPFTSASFCGTSPRTTVIKDASSVSGQVGVATHVAAQSLVSMEAKSLPSSFTRKKIAYGAIRVPVPNKRVFTEPEGSSKSLSRSYGDDCGTIDDSVEITTRLIVEDGPRTKFLKVEVPGSNDVFSEIHNSGTYEASFSLLVPKACLIKQITIGLKMDQD